MLVLGFGSKISGCVSGDSEDAIADVYFPACNPNDNTMALNGGRTDSKGFYTILT